MNPVKTEFAVALLNDVGCGVEDMYEAAKSRIILAQGEVSGLQNGLKSIQSVALHLKGEVKDGKLEIAEGDAIMRYIERCQNGLQNLIVQSELGSHQARGRAAALKQVVDNLTKRRDAEKGKLEAYRKAKADGKIVADADGVEVAVDREGAASGGRPGPSIADLRREEDAKAKEVSEETDPGPEEEPQKKPVPKKKKRVRKKASNNGEAKK